MYPALGQPPAAVVLYRPDVDLLSQLLAAIGRDGRRIYIFANGVLEKPVEQLLSTVPNCEIERSSENVGLGAGLNAVMHSAGRDGFGHLLLFDQDSTPDPDLARDLLARFLALDAPSQPMAALGPRLTPPNGSNYIPIRYSRREGASFLVGCVDFLPTSGSLVSIAAWRKTGPFRSDYFIGGSDVEWGYRSWMNGFASVLADDITMTHRWGREDPRGRSACLQIMREDDRRIYYYVRNAVDGLRLAHMPWRWKVRQVATLIGQFLALILSRRRITTTELFLRAFRDARRGELGPAPEKLFSRQ